MDEADWQETSMTFADCIIGEDDDAYLSEYPAPWEERLSRRGRGWRIALSTGALLVLFTILLLTTPGAGALLAGFLSRPTAFASPRILVATLIPWAQVWIDGRARGKPNRPFPTTPGRHTVVVRATGFPPLTAQLTLTAANHDGNLTYLPQPTPQAALAITKAINSALARIYHSTATVPLAPGQIYAPSRIATQTLIGALDLVMVDDDAAPSCHTRHPHPDQLSGCSGPLQFNGAYILDPRYALVVVRVVPQITLTTRAGQPVLIRRLALPDQTPVEARILVLLRPAGNEWSAQVLVPFPPNQVALTPNVLQIVAGRAALQQAGALAPGMPAPHVVYLPSVADGVVFTGNPMHGVVPIWLYRWGLLYAANAAARRLTPGVPAAPATLAELWSHALAP